MSEVVVSEKIKRNTANLSLSIETPIKLESDGYCCSCCFFCGPLLIEVYPKCQTTPYCMLPKRVDSSILQCCCVPCNLFSGRGYLTIEEFTHLSELHKYAFMQSSCSR